MTYPVGRSRENYTALLNVGVNAESRVVWPASEEEKKLDERLSHVEKLLKTAEANNSGVQPAELTLNGLIRTYAVIIFSELDKRLNEYTYTKQKLARIALMDEPTLASIERDPIYIRSAPDAGADIELMESGPGEGRFELHVRKGPQYEEDPDLFNRHVNSVFNVIMEDIDLSQVPNLVDDIIQEESEENVKPSTIRRLVISNRLDTRLDTLIHNGKPAKRESEGFYEKLQEIRILMEILGIKDADEVDSHTAVRFWETMGQSHVNVINLFFYINTRKQQVTRSANPYHHIMFDDCIRYSRKIKNPDSLQMVLEQKSKEVMVSNLALRGGQIEGFYQEDESQIDRLRMLYISWLVGSKDLVGVNRAAKQVLKRANLVPYDNRIKAMHDIYAVAKKDLKEEGERHEKGISEDTWDSWGVIDYDRTIPGEVDEYLKVANFFTTASLLGKYLFTNDKLDEELAKRLQ